MPCEYFVWALHLSSHSESEPEALKLRRHRISLKRTQSDKAAGEVEIIIQHEPDIEDTFKLDVEELVATTGCKRFVCFLSSDSCL